MPLPASLSTKDVHMIFTNVDGSPAVGRVILNSSPYRLTAQADNTIIPVGKLYVDLDENGEGTISDVPVVDDPDVAPMDWVWTVTEIIAGRAIAEYKIQILEADPATVELADKIPAVPAPNFGSFVTQQDLEAAVDAAMASSSELADAIADALLTASLNASNILTGTLPDARLSSNVMMDSEAAATYIPIAGTSTVTGQKTFSAGLGSTSLNAANLTGNVPSASMSANAVVLTGAQTVAGVKTFSNGFGSTSLNAANLTGNVPSASMSANAVVLTGNQTVAGDKTFSGITTVAGKIAVTNIGGITNQMGSLTTTSTSYVNLPGTTSFSFTKIYSSALTKLWVYMVVGYRGDVEFTTARGGVLINGVDTDICIHEQRQESAHTIAVGFQFVTGVPSGTYTVQGRIKKVGGNNIIIDSGDQLSLFVQEVPV